MKEEELADVMNEQINSLIESGQPIVEVLKNYLVNHRKEVIEGVIKLLKCDRYRTDVILGKTESRVEVENEICAVLGIDLNIYDEKEYELVRRLMSFVLGRDMGIIELTYKCIREELKK